MSRADEDSFATHLFEGGGHDASGNPLPAATRVILDADLDPSKTLVKGKEADVRIDWSRMQAMLSNGDTLHFGDTRLDFELRLEEAGWRVRRWVETVLPAGAVAQPIVSSGGGAASRIFLTLRARPQSKQGRLLFDLVLPKAGAVLEMFDVMGRRITRRDLSDLVPGRHTVALDGGSVPSGVYWARVRQNEATAVAKVVWVQ